MNNIIAVISIFPNAKLCTGVVGAPNVSARADQLVGILGVRGGRAGRRRPPGLRRTSRSTSSRQAQAASDPGKGKPGSDQRKS